MNPEVHSALDAVINAVERLANAIADAPPVAVEAPAPVQAPAAVPIAHVADERYLKLRAKLAGRKDA